MGRIFNIQRFSLFDGPGVRTVVFLKGCPLRCVWCHNPEGFSPQAQIMYNSDRCIGCGACVNVCQKGCHTIHGGTHIFDRTNCVSCGACAKACFSLSLTIEGKEMTVDEVMDIVARDKHIYRDSGGGLTLSGGEPLMQGAFSVALLKAAQQQGIHTCVETSGFGSSDTLREMASCTDLFLFDYKITGDAAHANYCGVPSVPILRNLALLDRLEKAVVLRCPLIPGVNDTNAHLEGIAETALANTHSVSQIHIEPYHRLGISKSRQLGLTPGYEAETPDNARVAAFADALQQLCGSRIAVKLN